MIKRQIFLFTLFICSTNFFWSEVYSKTFEDQKIYEAEQNNFDNLEVMTDSLASAGNYLKMGDKGSVVWKVEIDSSAWYDLVFRYRSPHGEKAGLHSP